MVLRNVDNDGTVHDIIGINDVPAGDIEQVVTYQVSADERINVNAGDVIGFAWNSPIPKHVNDGDVDDDDVLLLKKFDMRPPDDLNVNERINASEVVGQPIRAYSIQAIVSGIVSITIIVTQFTFLTLTLVYQRGLPPNFIKIFFSAFKNAGFYHQMAEA